MNEVKGNYGIADPQDLHYIFAVVNQVLDKKHEFYSLGSFQFALKEVSLSQGREIQMNLVTDQNKLVGFNFSFTKDPNTTTSTIPFKQSIELEQPAGSLTYYAPSLTTIDVAAKVKGNIATQTPSGELAMAPPLEAKSLRVVSETRDEVIKSPPPAIQVNPNLIKIAAHLASRNEMDGLWLTGMALKTGMTLSQSTEAEKPPDMQAAGNAVIKRFEQVLPQPFVDFKNGGSPKPFNWKDPHSGKPYRFEFEAATFSEKYQLLTPATLKGFEQADTSKKTVFSAQLTDSKRERWLVEQCNFSKAQLYSLTACNRSSNSQKSVSSFESEP